MLLSHASQGASGPPQGMGSTLPSDRGEGAAWAVGGHDLTFLSRLKATAGTANWGAWLHLCCCWYKSAAAECFIPLYQ